MCPPVTWAPWLLQTQFHSVWMDLRFCISKELPHNASVGAVGPETPSVWRGAGALGVHLRFLALASPACAILITRGNHKLRWIHWRQVRKKKGGREEQRPTEARRRERKGKERSSFPSIYPNPRLRPSAECWAPRVLPLTPIGQKLLSAGPAR